VQVPTATKAGRYELLGELGHGAMGVVYRAKDPLIGRTVALKTIRLSEEGTGLTHAQLVERFQNETRAAGLLSHPNIVVIYDAGESDGLCYIALELVNGKSMESLLESGEKFSTPRLLNIMEQVCSALQYAHHNNVVHRDIKPANIMLTPGDVVKITDFGTAKILQYGAARESNMVGTPSYMSPEQVKGSFVDGRTDIFSLGVMLYEITTGKRPFSGNDLPSTFHSILNDEPPPPCELNSSVPLGVSSAIMKALSKSPHLRYESCADFLEDLKSYRPGNTVASPSATRPPVAQSREKSFDAPMPKIPGVTPRPSSAVPRKPIPKPASLGSTFRDDSSENAAAHIPGVYAGPPPKFSADALKRYAKIAAGILVALYLGNFALKTFSHASRSDSDTTSTPQQVSPRVSLPSAAVSAPAPPLPAPLFVSASHPRIATLTDFAEPWASKSFIFTMSKTRRVPALLIRLPGPATESSSYWAFSLEAPFNQCELEYIHELPRLASEYGVPASHPMVVDPCSHTVFDPLQFKETPGNTFVRGAIVKGSDLRPPYAIEVKVSSDQILATAME